MSRRDRIRCFLLMATILTVMLTNAPAHSLELAPFKNKQFNYPGVSQTENGRYNIVDYDELRDINARDEIPERRVKNRYVSLGVRREQEELTFSTIAGPISYFAVGQRTGAALIVVYLHGKGGNRKQGVDDFTFGGNFNRLKNLMVSSNGLYLSPDVADFDKIGTEQIAELIHHYNRSSPHAPVIVACGSMGGQICQRLAKGAAISRIIKGFVMLGTAPAESIFSSSAFKNRTPFVLGHGSRDQVFPIAAAEAFFRQFEALKAGYPARFLRFESGTHGTPIRMIDWRQEINWILTNRGQ